MLLRHPLKTPTVHPGVLLRELILPALALSVTQAARDLQITRQTLHRILAGEAAITPDMAARLERLCGIRPQFWLGLQQDCDLERLSTQCRAIYDLIPSHKLPNNILNEIGVP
jgi:antitoxin HigA-1